MHRVEHPDLLEDWGRALATSPTSGAGEETSSAQRSPDSRRSLVGTLSGAASYSFSASFCHPFRSPMRVSWLGCVDMNSGGARPGLAACIRSQNLGASRGS